jgi:glucose-6-phosphate 1-dehydrogenase
MNNKFQIPTVFVIFGITGDLVKRKILFSLFDLYSKNLLPKMFQIVGFSRREWNDEQLRIYLHDILTTRKDIDESKVKSFLVRCFYCEGDFDSSESYMSLALKLGNVDGEWKVCSNKLFYLAVPPSSYRPIVTHLKESGLTIPCGEEEGWTRVILEKPFGDNYKNAQELDQLLGQYFKEEQIYRVDHYLGKETVRNILAFRFTNSFLAPSWNNKNIESIHIRLYEKDGITARGNFYDGVGALRDVGQNHLLQLMALFMMDDPSNLSSENIRQKRIELLSKIIPISHETVDLQTTRGQYKGYLQEEGVTPDSKTETYFKIRLFVNDHHWLGVPVTLEAGKAMGEDKVEVEVAFKDRQNIVKYYKGNYCHNVLLYTIQPHEKINVSFLVKEPGHENYLKEKKFEFDYKNQFAKESFVEPYEKLILDMIKGDQTLFVSTEEILAEWNFVEPILDSWKTNNTPLHVYEKGKKFVHQVQEDFNPLPKEIAVVGLGKMGSGLALNLVRNGWKVFGYNRTYETAKRYETEGITVVKNIKDIVSQLPAPRVILLSLPAGAAIDETLFGTDGLIHYLQEGDIVIDGGNSFYKDSQKRAQMLKKNGIHFVDAGISGGPSGALHGACIMVGGEKKTYEYLLPLFTDLSLPQGVSFFEGFGAGHFVKMVHNGIEYGMMQSIGEGFEVIKRSEYDLDLQEVARIYNKGSVIESRLINWLYEAYIKYGTDLSSISGSVNYTGEGEWTVKAANEEKVPVKIIEESFKFRQLSQTDPSYTGQVVSALRNMFGGHDVTKK